MKRILIILLSVTLLFMSNFGVATDASETAKVEDSISDLHGLNTEDLVVHSGEVEEHNSDDVSIEDAQSENGKLPYIVTESGKKVELTDDFNFGNLENNALFMEQLKQIKYSYKIANGVNKDVKGWLHFGNYAYQPFVDTPKQFDKYFRANLYGKFDWAGLPFMSVTSESTLEGNALIYGHNMNNGTAFGKIRHVDSAENFVNAPPLIVYDGQKDTFYFYKIFTIFRIVDGEEFITLKEFSSEEERQNYNKYLLKRSRHKMEEGWNIDWGRKTLFLQMCQEYMGPHSSIRRVCGFYDYLDLDGSKVDISNFKGGK